MKKKKKAKKGKKKSSEQANAGSVVLQLLSGELRPWQYDAWRADDNEEGYGKD